MRRTRYLYDATDWPRFRWDPERLVAPLAEVRHRQGRLIGRMEALGFPLRQEAVLATLTEDVVKSSEIEGEILNAGQVRSSIARRLGMDVGGLEAEDRHVEGVVEMMLDATRKYDEAVTDERLFAWHAALFPTARSGMKRIAVGSWRKPSGDPMQVVSGRAGREKIHYEAPAASKVDRGMTTFMRWFNKPPETDEVLKAALAHLWFVTIHPFEDGNGRIARAIADMALARSEKSPQRFYSMSAQIRKERGAYYDILEKTQKATMDVTPWMEWFLGCLGHAIEGAHTILGAVLAKAEFWERIGAIPLNERRRLLLNRLLEDFKGNLTTAKWAKIAKCSHDTALRDISELVERGILAKSAEGGRSTRYALSSVR